MSDSLEGPIKKLGDTSLCSLVQVGSAKPYRHPDRSVVVDIAMGASPNAIHTATNITTCVRVIAIVHTGQKVGRDSMTSRRVGVSVPADLPCLLSQDEQL